MPINISNPKGRDAVVALEALNPKREVSFTDAKGRPVITRKLLKTDTTHDLPEILKNGISLESLADLLINGDPEIDMESFGMFLTDHMSRVYITKKGIIHLVEEIEVIYNADGTVRERRPRKKEQQLPDRTPRAPKSPRRWGGARCGPRRTWQAPTLQHRTL